MRGAVTWYDQDPLRQTEKSPPEMLDIYKTHLAPAGWSLDAVHHWVVDKVVDMRLFNGKSLGALALASQVVIGLEVEKRDFDVFQYVDPLIGTADGGMDQLGSSVRSGADE